LKDSLDILSTYNEPEKLDETPVEYVSHDSLNILRTDVICHHGILGMKWGIRRYQNKDGSLTAAGKKRQEKLLKKAEAKANKAAERATKNLEKNNTKGAEPNRISAEDAAKRLGINDSKLVSRLATRDRIGKAAIGLETGKTKEEKWLNYYNDERNLYAREANMFKGSQERYNNAGGLMGALSKASSGLSSVYDKLSTHGWDIRTEQIKHLMKDIEARGEKVLSKPSYRQNGNLSWMGEELYVVPNDKEKSK
jgi:hypothetical protein